MQVRIFNYDTVSKNVEKMTESNENGKLSEDK